ncbi:hypothetical protein Tco_0545981, partial [Tanacetum coccineum]
EKVFVITALKNNLRKFKGKDIVNNAAQASNATTIALGMNKLDPVALAPKDKNNRETHIYYLKHTMKQAAILWEILLGYVRETCPNIHKPSEKLVVVTTIKKKTVSSMFDARNELCFFEFVSDMNASSKSKSIKKAKNKEEWKPTRKVFTKIGYNWRPTGRTFTLVGNACPLTRITATNKVPLREPIPLEVVAQESVVTKVYTRRPKVPKTTGSNSKPKIAKSMISNKMEPDTSWGSNTLVAPSSSSVDLRLANLFGPLYEEYYETSSPEVSDNSAANTLNNENISSLSSIVVKEDEAPQIVSSSAKQVATELNSPILDENADEFIQEYVEDFNGNVFYNAPPIPVFEEAASSSTYQDPSNMYEFHQKHRSSDRWTKNHPIEQVIGDLSKPVMIRNQLQTDVEVCMYALPVSIIEPKSIKEVMLDASWIESMQDELNQFKRLDVWELFKCPIGRNIITIK